MTKREFCELMADGCERVGDNLAQEMLRMGSEHPEVHIVSALRRQERFHARAFRDLAKEQPND